MSDSSEDETAMFPPSYSDDDDDENPKKRRRTMKSLRGQGLGFVKSTEVDDDEEDQAMKDASPDAARRRGLFQIGEYSEQPTTDALFQDEPSPPAPQVNRPSFFSNGKAASANSFAAKMMEKMGYKQGQGLGASGQGIVKPIEAQVLRKGEGLGTSAAQEETPRKRSEKRKEKPSSSTPASTPKPKAPPKTKYQTVSDIEARGLAVPAALKSIIIDATGKEPKTLSSAAGWMTPTRGSSPETESSKIAKRAKRDLEAFADAWNAETENKARVDEQQVRIQEELSSNQNVIQRLQAIVQTLEGINLEGSTAQGLEDFAINWAETIAKLDNLQATYRDRIEEYALSEAAVASVEPLFKRHMVDWDPLSDPDHFVSSLQQVDIILGIDHEPSTRRRKGTTCYESMILLHWFPRVRDVLNREWDVHHPDEAVTLLKSWQVVLPLWIQSKVIDEVIVPKLIVGIKAFRPPSRRDRDCAKNGVTPPLHAWLFDWLPLLGEDQLNPKQAQGILAQVQTKLDADSWVHWKPLLGDGRPVPASEAKRAAAAAAAATPDVKRPTTTTRPPATVVLPEVTFKEVVEDWCIAEDLMMVPLHQPHQTGLPLYRLRAASGKKAAAAGGGGVVVYLQRDVVWSEAGQPFGLDDRLAALARGQQVNK